jgi:hypothetical protein
MMHTTTEPATVKVPIFAHHRDVALAKLAKLQRRAARYGQTISWTERQFVEQRKVTMWDGKTKVVDVARIELAVAGSAPRCGDYTFMAQLELAPGGVLVSEVPGVEIGDLGFKWDGRCDHCGSNRARKVAFIVEGPDGRKVVGKSCLRDHLGMDAPEGLLWQFAQFADLTADRGDDEESWGGGSYRWEEMTLGVVATARAAMALWGWRPSSHEGQTTARHTMLLFERPSRDSKGRDPWAAERQQLRDELKANSDHYYRTAEAVIEWGKSLTTGRSDYERNLSVALNADVVVGKTFNLVVSAAAAYDRQVAREDEARKAREAEEARKASMPKSMHVGQAGERITATVTLERRVVLPDNGYGVSYIFKFRADDGPVLAWKTSSDARVDMTRADGSKWSKPVVVNDRVVIAATVKDHAEFRGEKETRVLRAKFAPIAK